MFLFSCPVFDKQDTKMTTRTSPTTKTSQSSPITKTRNNHQIVTICTCGRGAVSYHCQSDGCNRTWCHDCAYSPVSMRWMCRTCGCQTPLRYHCEHVSCLDGCQDMIQVCGDCWRKKRDPKPTSSYTIKAKYRK